jgi:hypothetical protein
MAVRFFYTPTTIPPIKLANREIVAQEADRVSNKACKIGTTFRKIVPQLPHVDGAIRVVPGSVRDTGIRMRLPSCHMTLSHRKEDSYDAIALYPG